MAEKAASADVRPEEGAMLSAKSLAVARGGRLLLSRIDIELSAGDALLLTGANGIGKSSLLRVLAGLLPAYAGEVSCRGDMAYADGNSALDMQMALRDALLFWARIDGRRNEAGTNVDTALKAMRLHDIAELPVHMLSTGQKRRATLARLLLRNAAIWLLDEPANGLDSESMEAVGRIIDVHRACGGIVIAATHLSLPIEGGRKINLGHYMPKDHV